ncbi:MAG: CDP-alcohol phosphatidyltransferase family protein [Candidatus Eisenbacteria bacterium]|nr:CDP-alcohol phosphatidyltransferase family protein [Candidatus Eisenbacteria bacterium]
MLITTKQRMRRIVMPLARLCVRAGITPDQLSLAGLLGAVLSGLSLAYGKLIPALAWLAFSLLCDLLDGDVARLRAQGPSRFGAFLDSTLDRISEALLFAGYLVGTARARGGLEELWVAAWALALTGGFLVSYTRARAEGLGIECRIGIADRSLRMLLFIAMLLAGYRTSLYFLAALGVLNWVTVGQRAALVRREAGSSGPTSGNRGPVR